MTTPLRLKVIWQTNLLAIALDGSTPFNTYFLTSYYFCPRTNVWEQLKLELDTKLWLKPNEKIVLLNNVADIVNYWQESRDKDTLKIVKSRFTDVTFVNPN